MVYQTYYASLIGSITLASDGENIIGLWMEGQKYYGDTVSEKMIKKDDLVVFTKTKKWLDKYFAGGKTKYF